MFDIAGISESDFDAVGKLCDDANKQLESAKDDIDSVLQIELASNLDPFLQRIKREVQSMKPKSDAHFLNEWMHPKGQCITRDTLALGEGTRVPVHYAILGQTQVIMDSLHTCGRLAELCERATAHSIRKERSTMATSSEVRNKVFIGHGQSPVWRELKDFLHDRLNVPYEEFNRVPVAGYTTIDRLTQMLDSAVFAFIILTAEDQRANGEMQARMNVIHEAGLFQGKLGFRKAVVLLEDTCAEFSNIQGLGQIRFPQGKISTCFDEVRKVLEREAIINGVVHSPSKSRVDHNMRR